MEDNPSEKAKEDQVAGTTEEEKPAEESEYTAAMHLARLEREDKGQIPQISFNPLLKKIARILTNSQATDWVTGGKELTQETRVVRPQPVYEFAYVRDVKDKSLVLKSSIPVRCQYAPGGYIPVPSTSPQFSIEIRDRVFDPDKLVDPKYANNFKGKYLEVIATGEIAQKLFLEVHHLVKGSSKNLQREFLDTAAAFYETLLGKVEQREIKQWSSQISLSEGKEITSYKSSFENFEITVSRSVEGWDVHYEVLIRSNKFEFSRNGSTPKLVFLEIQNLEQENQLRALEDKLKSLGLEDDLE